MIYRSWLAKEKLTIPVCCKRKIRCHLFLFIPVLFNDRFDIEFAWTLPIITRLLINLIVGKHFFQPSAYFGIRMEMVKLMLLPFFFAIFAICHGTLSKQGIASSIHVGETF